MLILISLNKLGIILDPVCGLSFIVVAFMTKNYKSFVAA